MAAEAGERERDERYTHRLEAFSDIVLGFSLGQLAINSAIPPHAIEILTRPAALFAYIVTFGIVVSVWSLHHRLFSEYFVPNRLLVALNFLTLGCVVYLSYTVQVYVHFSHASQSDAFVAGALYFETLGIVFSLLGALYAISMYVRRPNGGKAERGYDLAARLLCMGLFLAIGIPILAALHYAVTNGAAVLLVAGVLIGRVIGRLIARAVPASVDG